jgi:hypothetical protein
MTDVDNARTGNSSAKTGNCRLNVEIDFSKSDSLENSLHEVFDVLSDENVRHDKNTAEIRKLFGWYFELRRQHVQNDVL